MSYEESSAKCGWCGKVIYDGDETACRACHQTLEHEVSDLQARVEVLLAELAEAKAACGRLVEAVRSVCDEMENAEICGWPVKLRAALAAIEEEARHE